jgi:DNA-binding LacI/PurR family transcriptional regulator
MGVTQQQLAEKFGVTSSLVSKALSGHPRVSEETRQRILKAAEEMGYDNASNVEARRLAARRYGRRVKTGTLALVAPGQMSSEEARSIPFYTPLYNGVEDEATASGLDVIACRPRHGILPKPIAAGGVDGIVALDYFEALESLIALGIPVVSLEFKMPGITGILPDEREGMKRLVHHLAEMGHRDIAYVSFQIETPQIADRLAGYKQGLALAALPYREELVDATLSGLDAAGEAAVQLYDRLSDRPYSALICFNDWMAMSAVRALQAHGVSVPEDVSVAGFDDISLDHHFEPSLTSIAYDRYAMARRAVRVIRQAIQEDRPCEDKEEIFPIELVVRQSTMRMEESGSVSTATRL